MSNVNLITPDKYFSHRCECPNCFFGTKKIHSVEENKRKFEIKNVSAKHICQVQLDGCFIPKGSGGSTADFLFTVQDTKQSCFDAQLIVVELKGTDVKKAVSQIECTFKKFLPKLKMFKLEKRAFVISKSCPKADNAHMKAKKIEMRKKGIKLETGCQKIEV